MRRGASGASALGALTNAYGLNGLARPIPEPWEPSRGSQSGAYGGFFTSPGYAVPPRRGAEGDRPGRCGIGALGLRRDDQGRTALRRWAWRRANMTPTPRASLSLPGWDNRRRRERLRPDRRRREQHLQRAHQFRQRAGVELHEHRQRDQFRAQQRHERLSDACCASYGGEADPVLAGIIGAYLMPKLDPTGSPNSTPQKAVIYQMPIRQRLRSKTASAMMARAKAA
jgi:hypothetical protein